MCVALGGGVVKPRSRPLSDIYDLVKVLLHQLLMVLEPNLKLLVTIKSHFITN